MPRLWQAPFFLHDAVLRDRDVVGRKIQVRMVERVRKRRVRLAEKDKTRHRDRV